MIDAVKNAENLASKKQNVAQKQAELIVQNAYKDAKNIVKAKVKEANAKADLRFNFAKNSVEDSAKKNAEKYTEKIKNLKENSTKLMPLAIKTVVSLIAD